MHSGRTKFRCVAPPPDIGVIHCFAASHTPGWLRGENQEDNRILSRIEMRMACGKARPGRQYVLQAASVLSRESWCGLRSLTLDLARGPMHVAGAAASEFRARQLGEIQGTRECWQ